MQDLVVALLVLGCAVYAAWTLMPAVARRSIATALLRLPLPEGMAGKMRKASTVASGCGCDGCDHAPAKKSPTGTSKAASHVITFHPRARR